MKAFQCDRCQQFYPWFELPNDFLMLSQTNHEKGEEVLVDLCPVCQEALEAFLHPTKPVAQWPTTILPNLDPQDVEKVKEAGLLSEPLGIIEETVPSPYVECPNCLRMVESEHEHSRIGRPEVPAGSPEVFSCKKRHKATDINDTVHCFDEQPSKAMLEYLMAKGPNPNCKTCYGHGTYGNGSDLFLCTCKTDIIQIPF